MQIPLILQFETKKEQITAKRRSIFINIAIEMKQNYVQRIELRFYGKKLKAQRN